MHEKELPFGVTEMKKFIEVVTAWWDVELKLSEHTLQQLEDEDRMILFSYLGKV